MEDLKNKIQQAEEKFLESLFKYCENLFTNKKIISHNHTHHLRVWEYAKEILHAIDSNKINYNTVEACLIASLFHDTGLTKTTNENHGKQSQEVCIKYFEENNITKPDSFKEILYAIEKHDNKEYKLNNNTPDSIFSILCNADDLDAFGQIGVIRYTEIYLLRGISIKDLPELVIKNLNKRFLNFENTYKNFPDLYAKHKSRYLITRNFFEELIEETT